MLRMMCKSKIHRAKITKVNLHYEGSIGIDKDLLKASDIFICYSQYGKSAVIHKVNIFQI